LVKVGAEMNLYTNERYLADIGYVCQLDLPWEKIKEKNIFLSGATGMIGSFFVDVLLYKDIGINVCAISRDTEKAKMRFSKWGSNKYLHLIECDININENLLTGFKNDIQFDYCLHLASNTHPVQYATDPIGTIMTNIIGLKNMLDYAVDHQVNRFVFASSNEIYGENRGDKILFDERYCGYIDSNTMRAGYPESKRCGEALCQAYISQKKLDVVIPRFTRTYGPTMLMNDTKAISQFIKNGISREDIVLKSEGNQYFSYTYVADAVSGLLTVMLNGDKGEAYNISDKESDIKLRDLAMIIAKIAGTKVVYDSPDVIEAAGYSKSTIARLDGSKLCQLGWKPRYNIITGVNQTINILRESLS